MGEVVQVFGRFFAWLIFDVMPSRVAEWIDWAIDPQRARATSLVASLVSGNLLLLGLVALLGGVGAVPTDAAVLGIGIGNVLFIVLERARVI